MDKSTWFILGIFFSTVDYTFNSQKVSWENLKSSRIFNTPYLSICSGIQYGTVYIFIMAKVPILVPSQNVHGTHRYPKHRSSHEADLPLGKMDLIPAFIWQWDKKHTSEVSTIAGGEQTHTWSSPLLQL